MQLCKLWFTLYSANRQQQNATSAGRRLVQSVLDKTSEPTETQQAQILHYTIEITVIHKKKKQIQPYIIKPWEDFVF